MDNLEHLIMDLKESLERQLTGLELKVDRGFAEVRDRLDTQSSRLERQGGIVQAGARWTSRMDNWAERVDVALEAKDREIADLRERIARLERKSA